MASVSFIIPTIGRSSLKRTLASIGEQPGDQVIVVKDIPPSRMWGNPQRNKAMEMATCDYLSFMDDDDTFAPGAREIIERAIDENPQANPILFKIKYPDGRIIWKQKKVIPGNISTQMILVPNKKEMLYHWQDGRNMADFIFVDNWKWPKEQIIWREEIIALMGHSDEALKI